MTYFNSLLNIKQHGIIIFIVTIINLIVCIVLIFCFEINFNNSNITALVQHELNKFAAAENQLRYIESYLSHITIKNLSNWQLNGGNYNRYKKSLLNIKRFKWNPQTSHVLNSQTKYIIEYLGSINRQTAKQKNQKSKKFIKLFRITIRYKHTNTNENRAIYLQSIYAKTSKQVLLEYKLKTEVSLRHGRINWIYFD